MKVIQANVVLNFLSQNPSISILQFYQYVTSGGKNFNYYISAPGNDNWNVLQLACKSDNKELVRALLKMGANPNFSRNRGLTPLYDAIDVGSVYIVKMLIEHGAKCDHYGDSYLRTYLDFAKRKGNQQIIDYLADQLKNDSAVTESDENFLQKRMEIIREFTLAIKESDHRKSKILLEKYPINIPEIFFNFSDGCTRVAAAAGNLELVKLLAKYGDELIEATHLDDNKSIPTMAREAGFIEIAQFLENTQKESYKTLKTEGFKQLKGSQVKRNNSPFFEVLDEDLATDLKTLFNDEIEATYTQDLSKY